MKILVDGHCDTIGVAYDEQKVLKDKSLSFNLADALKPSIQMLAIFVNPKYEKSFERAKNVLEYFNKEKEHFTDDIVLVKTSEDIEKVITNNKMGLLLTIENGRAIENNLNNIDYFYNEGVRVMSINWNEDNLLGSGALTSNDMGLTSLGKEYVKKLNERNIIVDVSHSSLKTFWDAVKISEKPLVATHSCCKSICEHPRNLTDEQIKQIAKLGGIVGICYCKNFLTENESVTVTDVAKHISYIANLVGTEYVGLGSDFDGLEKEELPTNLTGISQIQNLENELYKFGFNENEINKIMGENWIRVLNNQI